MRRYQIPAPFVWATFIICLAPSALNLLGVYFGTPIYQSNVFANSQLYQKGQITYTLLVCLSVPIAFLTVILSFIDYSIKKEVSIPIVGVSLFCAGILDLFHILVATDLVHLEGDQQVISQFTWIISRTFHALIVIIGTGIFLLMHRDKDSVVNTDNFVFYISLIFVLLTFLVINILFSLKRVPDLYYPNQFLSSPFNLVPIVLYILSGLFVLPAFYLKYPSTFSQLLILSLVPAIFTEVHIALSNPFLFDNHFYIGHFLQIITYLIPFLGLSLKYLQTHQNEQKAIKTLGEEVKERMMAEKLALTGRFARTIAHEVRNPLTNISLSVGQLTNEVLTEPDLDKAAVLMYMDIVKRNGERINQLITELLNSTKPEDLVFTTFMVETLMTETLALAKDRIQLKEIELIPQFAHEGLLLHADLEKVKIALLNIIINAVEAVEAQTGSLVIRTVREGQKLLIDVIDNGPGISSENVDRLFEPFFTSKPKGTGLGLTSTQNIIYSHKGAVFVDPSWQAGTKFTISLDLFY